MLHSQSDNNKVKVLHKRCLQLIYNDKQSSYEELLINDSTVSIHYRNIQTLATEMFKVKNEMSPEIICDIFTQRINNHYNLRHINHFETPFVRTVYNGTKSVSYLGPKIWDIVPEEYKTLNSLNSFKESIKNWVPLNCPCRLVKPMYMVLVLQRDNSLISLNICILKVSFLSFVKILHSGSLKKTLLSNFN